MPMKIEELVKPAADWTGESWGARVDHAASLLFLHGYISQTQREKVTHKLEKQYRDGLTSGKIVAKKDAEA